MVLMDLTSHTFWGGLINGLPMHDSTCNKTSSRKIVYIVRVCFSLIQFGVNWNWICMLHIFWNDMPMKALVTNLHVCQTILLPDRTNIRIFHGRQSYSLIGSYQASGNPNLSLGNSSGLTDVRLDRKSVVHP